MDRSDTRSLDEMVLKARDAGIKDETLRREKEMVEADASAAIPVVPQPDQFHRDD